MAKIAEKLLFLKAENEILLTKYFHPHIRFTVMDLILENLIGVMVIIFLKYCAVMENICMQLSFVNNLKRENMSYIFKCPLRLYIYIPWDKSCGHFDRTE